MRHDGDVSVQGRPPEPVGISGLPSCPQHEVVQDPARLERAATLTDCGLGLALTGWASLGRVRVKGRRGASGRQWNVTAPACSLR